MSGMLICPKAHRKDGDRRGKIMCKVSGLPCAHQFFCSVSMKYKQLDSAKDCPGRSENAEV